MKTVVTILAGAMMAGSLYIAPVAANSNTSAFLDNQLNYGDCSPIQRHKGKVDQACLDAGSGYGGRGGGR